MTRTIESAAAVDGPPVPRVRALPLVALGALCGLVWAAALRAYMVELVDAESRFGWLGTFAGLLLPGTITGALLGWAESIRRAGGRRRWRLLALAPLALIVGPMLLPDAIPDLVTQGLGGGAIAVTLFGLGAGWAISGRGPRWGRVPVGVLCLLGDVAIVLTSPAIGGGRLALTSPRGAWVALLVAGLLALLALAAAIPHRPVAPVRRP